MRNILFIASLVFLQGCIGFTQEHCTSLTGWCSKGDVGYLPNGWYIKNSDNLSNIAYEEKVNKDLRECRITDRFQKSQDPLVNKCMKARGWEWEVWGDGD